MDAAALDAAAAARAADEEERLKAETAAERASFLRVIAAFRSYEADALAEVERWEANHALLPPAHRLPSQVATFAASRAAVAANAAFLRDMLAAFGGDEAPAHLRVPPPPPGPPQRSAPGEAEKVRYVLRNLVRDWSEEGSAERAGVYAPLVSALARHLPPYAGPPGQPPRVLVPGAGLGRLCCELVAAGYAAEGCEWSHYMLIASSYLMNVLGGGEQALVHPWVLSSCNNVAVGDAARPILVPDVCAAELVARMPPGCLSMAAGDFSDVYGAPEMAGSFDAVATSFFIDCSHDILHTVDVLRSLLRPGGVWVNCGPLLYHWADAHTYLAQPELSLELPLEEVKAYALRAGFRLEEEGWRECGYAENGRGMMSTRYRCATWTMVRE